MSENLTNKNPYEITAQIATFATEHVPNYDDVKHIFHNIGELAAQAALSDVVRITTQTEYDPNNNYAAIPVGSERPAIKSSDYIDYQRSVGGSRYESIRGRADMLRNYEHFAPAIAILRSELITTPDDLQHHKDFLGNGLSAQAYTILVDDTRYVARIPKGRNTQPETVDGYIAGGILGKSIPHVEQIIAASYEDGVTIAELIPGAALDKLTTHEIAQISDSQLATFVDTALALNKRGAMIDPKLSNFLYDPDEGYGIIDYQSANNASQPTRSQTPVDVAQCILSAVSDSGLGAQRYTRNPTAENIDNDRQYAVANLDVTQRYRRIAGGKFTGPKAPIILQRIDDAIADIQQSISSYSNPEWVAAYIEDNNPQKRVGSEQAYNPDDVEANTM